MAGKITIRNVPEHVHQALVVKAAEAGKSLQQYLLEWLTVLAMPQRAGTKR